MGQYSDKVERQRLLLEAEEWATGIRDIHLHSITSMWYETAESKAELLRNGPVTVSYTHLTLPTILLV